MDHVRMGSGEPLVLVHFQGGHARSWEPLFEPLAAEFEVFAVALPGYGTTPVLREPATMAALARSVIGFMAGAGHASFHVAGISLGGGVALEIGHQGAARSVCAISPAGFAQGADKGLLLGSIALYRASSRALAGAASALSRPAWSRRATVWQMATHGERWSPDYLEALLHSVATAPGYRASARHALRERFARGDEIACPVTVAWGDTDRLLLTRPQSGRARADLPRARHVSLRDCGHIPLFDDPGQVLAAVRSSANVGDHPL